MVVHGLDGLDEITTTTKTKVSELKNGMISNYVIDPRQFDIPLTDKEDLAGGDAEKNASIILNIVKGETGGKRNMVLINAGAAIYVGNAANSLQEGIDRAAEVIDMGLALDKLNQLIKLSQELKV